MKKINLKGISEILSENEMKNVMGGATMIGAPVGMKDKTNPAVMAAQDNTYCFRCSAWEHSGGQVTAKLTGDYDDALTMFAANCEAGGLFWEC